MTVARCGFGRAVVPDLASRPRLKAFGFTTQEVGCRLLIHSHVVVAGTSQKPTREYRSTCPNLDYFLFANHPLGDGLALPNARLL
jgi:hypothetical protein